LNTFANNLPAQILMIDDNRVDAMLLRQALDSIGKPYILEILSDADEAIRFIDNAGLSAYRSPDLIIVDLHLPKSDGITILEKLRCNAVLSEVPVAVLPTLASPQEDRRVREMGVRLYRTKPISWNDTVALTRELLDICVEPRPVSEGHSGTSH